MNNIIVAENVTKWYKIGNVYALNKINLSIAENTTTAIIGKSGCGKTTLLNILGGLDFPTDGKVYILGEEITKLKETKLSKIRANNLGFVFQFYNLIPELTAYQNILFPLAVSKKEIDEKYIKSIMTLIGINSFSDRLPAQLSGGQQQRVAIARALAHKPSIILMDEPTGNLDEENSNRICELIKNLHKELNQTILYVTHDMDMAKSADRIIKLKDGVFVDEDKQ